MGRDPALGPGTADTVDAGTWIWSDLHLGHEPSRVAFRRPFRSAAEADRVMMEAWEQHVGERESIICLGDVSVDGDALDHHQEWWAKSPGRKWLVLGNHDVDLVNRRFQADRRDVALYADGEPPLLLTHVPLRDVPAGTVNVHGHLHLQEPPTEDRHLSVCVEQLSYRPVRLSDHPAPRAAPGRRPAGSGTQHPVTAELDGPAGTVDRGRGRRAADELPNRTRGTDDRDTGRRPERTVTRARLAGARGCSPAARCASSRARHASTSRRTSPVSS